MALEEATVNISYRNLSRRLQECDPVILHGASAHRLSYYFNAAISFS